MLISALNSGLSGMRANETALDSSAHNVANADTQGFNPQQVSFQENTNGGVIVNLSRGSAIAQQDNNGTDLENEVVQSIQYKAGFDVNAKMVKTADEMLGTLINTKA